MNMVAYQLFVVSFLAACGDLIATVFDFAHGMCALKLTEQQIALFSALVLINAGKTDSKLCCILLFICSGGSLGSDGLILQKRLIYFI